MVPASGAYPPRSLQGCWARRSAFLTGTGAVKTTLVAVIKAQNCVTHDLGRSASHPTAPGLVDRLDGLDARERTGRWRTDAAGRVAVAVRHRAGSSSPADHCLGIRCAQRSRASNPKWLRSPGRAAGSAPVGSRSSALKKLSAGFVAVGQQLRVRRGRSCAAGRVVDRPEVALERDEADPCRPGRRRGGQKPDSVMSTGARGRHIRGDELKPSKTVRLRVGSAQSS